MSHNVRLAVILAFAAFPLLEIGVLIRVAQSVGFWPLAAFVIATAVLGGIVLRRAGFSMFTETLHDLQRGRKGLEPLLDGFLRVTAAMLLIFPGLISDLLGLMLLVPPIRRQIVASGLLKSFGPTAEEAGARGAPAGRFDDMGSSTSRSHGVTIEGEYERVEEDPARPQTAPLRQSLRRR